MVGCYVLCLQLGTGEVCGGEGGAMGKMFDFMGPAQRQNSKSYARHQPRQVSFVLL